MRLRLVDQRESNPRVRAQARRIGRHSGSDQPSGQARPTLCASPSGCGAAYPAEAYSVAAVPVVVDGVASILRVSVSVAMVWVYG